MNRKYVFSLAAAAIGSGVIAISAAHAYGFGHHGHHGSGAAKACIAVMTHEQRAGLKTIFSDAKTNIIADHKAVKAAKEALAQAILSGDKALGMLEGNLSAAKLKLQQDEDAAAVSVCGLLNTTTQLPAAKTLYTNLVTLRENTHKEARAYFLDARKAAGDPAVQMQSQPQDAE